MNRVHRTALATTLLTAALTAWHSSPEAQAPPAGQAPGQERRRYVVEFAEFGPEARGLVRAVGGDVAHEFPRFRAIAAWLPEAALTALRNNPNVMRIEADPQRFPLAETIPYGIPMVQAPLVSDADAANRTVCIIDSGYSLGHPDLPAVGVSGVDDVGGAGAWSVDRCGHGTHVAGTIAALGNTAGVVGVLPGNTIPLHIVKVFDDGCSWAYASDLAAAVDQCALAGANVVNMSLGGPVSSTIERNAFDAAYADGILSIAAAGNGGNLAISYPAGYSSVVSVAAIDENRALAYFSQRNADVELAAPGVDVVSTVPWFEQNSVSVGSAAAYSGTWIEDAARSGSGGVTGILAAGGLCDSVGSWAGKVVLCERGVNYFSEKVANVEAGGGIATVIYNNMPGGFLGILMSPSLTPAIGISQEDGQALLANAIGSSTTVISFYSETGGGYEAWSGTSMATPHVTGVAALIWSHYPEKTNADVRAALTGSAEDLGAPGRDTSFGFGLVQAEAALNMLAGSTPPPPPANVILSAARKGKKVELKWSGATSTNVDIFRNGALHVAATANDGLYSDPISGRGSYTYQVCMTGTTSCSNAVTVAF
jgi:subtilisin family serine protease